ncbi:hypothetical protein KKF29_01265 [Patescibacteria group bacterium]|nr:hypothetical protein [Patescibacteria group bacterium]
MGIKVEFNPDLALRDYSEHRKGKRKRGECIPEKLIKGKIYPFLKKGQRLFWLSGNKFWGNGQIPLCKTNGNEKLSRPVASIKILEATHFLKSKEIWTKGKYKVVDVFNEKDPQVHFEAYKRI